MSLLDTIETAYWLCEFASKLEEDGAYDQTGTSTITASDEIPADSPSNCYALNLLSRWLESIKNRTKMDLASKLDALDRDLCYQSLLNPSNIQEPMTILFCNICDALRQNVVTMAKDGDEGADSVYTVLLGEQIMLSMYCIKILIDCSGFDQTHSMVNPKPKSLVSLMHSVYDLPSTHPLRRSTLHFVYDGVLNWLNEHPTFPVSMAVPRGLITVQCSSEMNRVTFLCREEIFVDLLFRGAPAFALQIDESCNVDFVCCPGCHQHNPIRFQSLMGRVIRRSKDQDKIERIIMPLYAPALMFPYVKRAKQKMICFLIESEFDGINIPEIATILTSYLFIAEKEQFYRFDEKFAHHEKGMEFLNWIRMMGSASRDDPRSAVSTKSMVAQEQFECFQETGFLQHLVNCSGSMSLSVMGSDNYAAPDLKYIDQLIRLHPPSLKMYQQIVSQAVTCYSACSEEKKFHLDVIGWLQHMEQVYGRGTSKT